MAKADRAEKGTSDTDDLVDLKARVCSLIDSLLGDEARARQEYADLLARAEVVWQRKLAMVGTKGETRDMILDVLFDKLQSTLVAFRASADARDLERRAEWLIASVFGGGAIVGFARALDQTMLEEQGQQDFNFAGQTDFIPIQEVLQLMSSGHYTGLLALEKADNRLDMFIRDGMVMLLDPHHLVRRMLPGARDSFREITPEVMEQAELLRASAGIPLLVGMHRLGFLRADELPDLLQNLGLEIFYEFLCETGKCRFSYKKLNEMPDYVDQFGHRMPVTPILLEGSKRMDEWRVLLEVFPNPDEEIKPMQGMLAMLDGLNLGVHEIKLLASLNNGASPRQLSASVGLPLFDIYQHLVRYARDGILVPVGGTAALKDITFTLEETMEKAFEALDANDDDMSTERALDVLADPFAKSGRGGSGGGLLDDVPGANETFLDVLARSDPGVKRRQGR